MSTADLKPSQPLEQVMASTGLRWRAAVSLTWPSIPAPVINLMRVP